MTSRPINPPDAKTAANSTSSPQRRIAWLDLTRAFAILTVILCHSTETIYSLETVDVAARSLLSQIVEFSLFSIGRLGVPLFLFMSGYLMLDRFYDKAACIKFWKTKWCGLVLATEIWIVIYNIFLSLAWGWQFSLWRLIRNMLFLESVPMGHMWYMPMIIGLYLFLPFIANGLKRIDSVRLLAFPLGIMAVLCFVAPVARVFAASLGETAYSFTIVSGFSGGTYGCYMLLGYCVKKNAFAKVPTFALASTFSIAFSLVVAVQLYGYNHGVRAAVWYDSGILLVAGLSLFLLFSRTQLAKESKAVTVLSRYSFALYLVHFPAKILLTPLIAALGIPSFSMQVVVLSALVLAVSLLLCIVIARIPKIGGTILYMR